MLKSVEGVYRDGKIELTETPGGCTGRNAGHCDISGDISYRPASAWHQRDTGRQNSGAQLGTFAEEWDSPEMEPYDNYDAAKAKL